MRGELKKRRTARVKGLVRGINQANRLDLSLWTNPIRHYDTRMRHI